MRHLTTDTVVIWIQWHRSKCCQTNWTNLSAILTFTKITCLFLSIQRLISLCKSIFSSTYKSNSTAAAAVSVKAVGLCLPATSPVCWFCHNKQNACDKLKSLSMMESLSNLSDESNSPNFADMSHECSDAMLKTSKQPNRSQGLLHFHCISTSPIRKTRTSAVCDSVWGKKL